MGANDRQVGGTHYQQAAAKEKGEQHWDRIWRLYGRGYFVGCITKYVERYHLKNGIQDLEKAKHYLEKLIELETADAEKAAEPVTHSKEDAPSDAARIITDDLEACIFDEAKKAWDEYVKAGGLPLPIINVDFEFPSRPVIACGKGAPEPPTGSDAEELPGNHV